MFDPQSGKQVDAQTSVFGSMVEHRFDTKGEDGSRKSVLVQENQDTGELVARTEQSVRKGLSETRTIAEDGSQSFARSGNVPLFLEVAGESRHPSPKPSVALAQSPQNNWSRQGRRTIPCGRQLPYPCCQILGSPRLRSP